jgi:hypothetical protein
MEDAINIILRIAKPRPVIIPLRANSFEGIKGKENASCGDGGCC